LNACIFVGPTLGVDQANRELDAIYLPPASEGDVYRVACGKPQAIGIIDGYFECIPAVWHKEILWAMAQGIHVYGCASMGALRAAELAAFGMQGVGRIFQDYVDGIVEDDDEVAVAHSSAERGYQPISVAMVNIRATLNAAETAGVIRQSTRRELERIAKDIFYQERSYAALFERAAERSLSGNELESLRCWLPTGQVDQKREDALAMLRLMRAQLGAGFAPKRVQYSFEYTANWEIARRRSRKLPSNSLQHMDAIFQENLLDELRLEGRTSAGIQQAALLRFLALEEAWRRGMIPTHKMIRNAVERFHREVGTENPEALECWLRENHLSHEEFLEFIEDQARLEWVHNVTEIEAAALVPDQLRHTGRYAELAKRACDKQRTLEVEGIKYPSLADARLTEVQLLRWYFEKRLGGSVPTDLAHYCRLAGFTNEDSFRRAILREYCYSAHQGNACLDKPGSL
jgi:hypothetical protein